MKDQLHHLLSALGERKGGVEGEAPSLLQLPCGVLHEVVVVVALVVVVVVVAVALVVVVAIKIKSKKLKN